MANISSVCPPNYFFADFWLGETIANGPFVHYPNEKWFPLTEDDEVPEGLLDPRLRAFYDPDDQLTASMLVDLQSGNDERGVCGPAVHPASPMAKPSISR
ncbi:Uncharacterised protein [Raoultella planticola]|uniref:Uncharacterized protein n=1 Tax=Raoultella planticola TaxID=575 RepID=A0A485CB72_RAOPL|nr:Uncharacterised protein [Raoultella planticola]